MHAFQPLAEAYAATSPTVHPLASRVSNHRLLHTSRVPLQPAPATPSSTRTPIPSPPPPPLSGPATPAAKPAPTGGLQAVRRWLQAQPPVVRGTIVGVFVVLATLESSFWAYNGYLRWQSHQAAKRREREKEKEEMERMTETE